MNIHILLIVTLSLSPAMAMDTGSSFDQQPRDINTEMNKHLMENETALLPAGELDPAKKVIFFKQQFAIPRSFQNIDSLMDYLEKAQEWGVSSVGPVYLECPLFNFYTYITSPYLHDQFKLLSSFNVRVYMEDNQPLHNPVIGTMYNNSLTSLQKLGIYSFHIEYVANPQIYTSESTSSDDSFQDDYSISDDYDMNDQ